MYTCVVCFSFLSVFSLSQTFSSYIIWFTWQMSSIPQFYLGYADGANRSSRHAASAAWIIFIPSNELVDAGSIFLGRATNNLAEYEVVISLMTNASTLGIHSLVIRLDSELVISQLTSRYTVRHPVLYRKYLRVHFLEHSFDVISYEHIPRTLNSLADSLANDILDWHLAR
jgi:ribonuclease HI